MIQRMLASALFAGCAVGLLAALLHFAFVQEYILLGEQYESGALTHFENAAKPAEPADHSHDTEAATTDGHSHEAPATASDAKRNALTVLFTVLIYTSYALLLTAGFALADSFGFKTGLTEGVLWGIAGFLAFQMAPAMGLAPELPGTIAADLGERQVWWWLTVACTGAALALLGLKRNVATLGLAALLFAVPHVVGAPHPDAYWGVAPPEVAATFTARVLGVALIVWASLGAVAGLLWSRDKTA